MSEKTLISEEQKQRLLGREASYCHTLETDKRHEKLFAPYGINFATYRTLAYLLLYPDGAAPSQIADDLYILRTYMTNILTNLEKKNMIVRDIDPNDRRRIVVRLLPDGEKLALEALREEEEYGRRVMRYISREELDLYHKLEQQMYEAKVSALQDVLSDRGS